MEAGRTCLREPLASNADEALSMAVAARRTNRILFEAFHYRYHPLAGAHARDRRLRRPRAIRHVDATMCIPLPIPSDIRYRWDLAGGAAMESRLLTINIVRFLAG